MPLIVLVIALTVSLALISLLSVPFDILHVFSVPGWLYLMGVVALLSWCLGD